MQRDVEDGLRPAGTVFVGMQRRLEVVAIGVGVGVEHDGATHGPEIGASTTQSSTKAASPMKRDGPRAAMIAAIPTVDSRQLTGTGTAPILDQAEDGLEARRMVAGQEHDPVARPDAGAVQRAHDPIRARVERGVRHRVAAVRQRGPIRILGGE